MHRLNLSQVNLSSNLQIGQSIQHQISSSPFCQKLEVRREPAGHAQTSRTVGDRTSKTPGKWPDSRDGPATTSRNKSGEKYSLSRQRQALIEQIKASDPQKNINLVLLNQKVNYNVSYYRRVKQGIDKQLEEARKSRVVAYNRGIGKNADEYVQHILVNSNAVNRNLHPHQFKQFAWQQLGGGDVRAEKGDWQQGTLTERSALRSGEQRALSVAAGSGAPREPEQPCDVKIIEILSNMRDVRVNIQVQYNKLIFAAGNTPNIGAVYVQVNLRNFSEEVYSMEKLSHYKIAGEYARRDEDSCYYQMKRTSILMQNLIMEDIQDLLLEVNVFSAKSDRLIGQGYFNMSELKGRVLLNKIVIISISEDSLLYNQVYFGFLQVYFFVKNLNSRFQSYQEQFREDFAQAAAEFTCPLTGERKRLPAVAYNQVRLFHDLAVLLNGALELVSIPELDPNTYYPLSLREIQFQLYEYYVENAALYNAVRAIRHQFWQIFDQQLESNMKDPRLLHENLTKMVYKGISNDYRCSYYMQFLSSQTAVTSFLTKFNLYIGKQSDSENRNQFFEKLGVYKYGCLHLAAHYQNYKNFNRILYMGLCEEADLIINSRLLGIYQLRADSAAQRRILKAAHAYFYISQPDGQLDVAALGAGISHLLQAYGIESDEAAAFWLVVRIIEFIQRRIPSHQYIECLIDYSQKSLRARHADLSELFQKYDLSLSALFANHVRSLFLTLLPTEVLFRLWDIWFFELNQVSGAENDRAWMDCQLVALMYQLIEANKELIVQNARNQGDLEVLVTNYCGFQASIDPFISAYIATKEQVQIQMKVSRFSFANFQSSFEYRDARPANRITE